MGYMAGWVNNNYFQFGMIENVWGAKYYDTGLVAIYMATNSNPNTNTFTGRINNYTTGIQLAGCYNRLVNLNLVNCSTRIKIVGASPKYNADGDYLFNITRKNYLFGSYGEIYSINPSNQVTPIPPYNGDTPILNLTDRPLSEVLTIFGWDKNTYLNQLFLNDVHVSSDKRLKENIENIQNSTEKILKLRGTKYNFKSRENKNDTLKHFGFIAQEVDTVLPELVSANPFDSLYSLNYTGVIPILTEAFKEQQKITEQNNRELQKLKEENLELMNLAQEAGLLSKSNSQSMEEQPILFSSVPYATDSVIAIKYYIPEYFTDKYLIITDMNGTLLLQREISNSGMQQTYLQPKMLKPGIYLYMLVANNYTGNIERLIITE
jgi:hypothetical protein